MRIDLRPGGSHKNRMNRYASTTYEKEDNLETSLETMDSDNEIMEDQDELQVPSPKQGEADEDTNESLRLEFAQLEMIIQDQEEEKQEAIAYFDTVESRY
jgi:hypothetical protein